MALTSCRKGEIIAKTSDGRALGAEDIDRDPLALLPGGAVALVDLDAQKLYTSQFGHKLVQVAERLAPVPAAANYEPERDLRHLTIGFYSMQGLDFAGVATGTFDRPAIEAAADGVQVTPQGVPVVRSEYAGRRLYTATNLGFSVLTNHTVLFGNETGIRRTLDRIAQGRIVRDIPHWALELLKDPAAPIVATMDLESNPVAAAGRERVLLLSGMSRLRLLGNFEPPGINLAGTSLYRDEASAQQGALQTNQLQQFVRSWGWMASVLGIGQPIRQLEARPVGKEVEFVVGLDASVIDGFLDQIIRLPIGPRRPSATGQ